MDVHAFGSRTSLYGRVGYFILCEGKHGVNGLRPLPPSHHRHWGLRVTTPSWGVFPRQRDYTTPFLSRSVGEIGRGPAVGGCSGKGRSLSKEPMAKQVSNTELTLIECIREGIIAAPPLLRWNQWQQWRAGEGKRPILSRDGFAIPQAQESALWKSVMNELHGPTWSIDLLSGEVAEGIDESAEPLTGQPSTLLPAAVVAEGDVPFSVEARAVSANVGATSSAEGAMEPPIVEIPLMSPGSGVPEGAESPGSGPQSVNSWSSKDPGSPQYIGMQILKGYNPQSETLEKYTDRLVRQAAVLDKLGQPLGAHILEALIEKAKYGLRLHQQVGDDMERRRRVLEREFALESVSPDGSDEQKHRIMALESLLRDQGVVLDDLRMKIALGQPVAPSPVREPEPPPVRRTLEFKLDGDTPPSPTKDPEVNRLQEEVRTLQLQMDGRAENCSRCQ